MLHIMPELIGIISLVLWICAEVSSVYYGSASDVEIQAANLIATLDRMRSIISRHTGRPIDEIVRDVGRDRWFDARGARDYGFVDHVVSSLDDIGAFMRPRSIGVTA